MRRARQAQQSGQIDASVLKRFQRVLQVLWLVSLTDPERILSPLVEREINAFIEDRTGEKNAMHLPPSRAIAALSRAVASELTLLRIEMRCLKSAG